MPPSAASKRPARALRAGEGARLGAEQLALEQVRRQRADVDLARTARTSTARVGLDDLGEHFLARAVRAGDQHRHVGPRHLRRHLHHGVHRRAAIDDAAQVEARRQLGMRAVDARQPLALGRERRVQLQQVAHGGDEPRVVPGLREVVGGAGLDQLDRGLEVRPGGEQDHRQVRLRARRARNSAMPSSPEVASRRKFMSWITRSMPPRATRSRPSRGVADALDTRALQRQQDVERRAHGVVVVDDE